MRPIVVGTMALLGSWLGPVAAVAQQTTPNGEAPRPAAVSSPGPVYQATRVPSSGEAPKVDGVLDEAIWQAAVVADDFVQIQPNSGQPASQRTEVRLLYHDRALYIGARLYDTHPDSIIAPLTRRDEDVLSDWFYVAFDSDHDRRTAFLFGVNPRGVRRDAVLFDDTREDPSWDPVWDAAVKIDAEGWTVEMRIPLSQLRFSVREEGEEVVWGLNFERRIGRHEEVSHWSPVPSGRRRLVSVFGELRGLDDLVPPRRLEVRPYILARMVTAPGDSANPFYRPRDEFRTIGVDANYSVTPGLTLTATVNPDFGEVEGDRAVISTTGYRTFFPEKRPFFLEGAQLFEYEIGTARLFHSRRIGREPQRAVDEPEGFVDAPRAANILGAAKLTGTTATGWSVGVIQAVTEEATARLADTLGTHWTEPVEPLTSSSVGRVVRATEDGSGAVGAMVTANNRRLRDGLGFLTSSAYSGGVDGRKRFAGGNYEISGLLVASHVRGSPESVVRLQGAHGRFLQRPDAPHLGFDSTRTSLTGFAATASLMRVGRGPWRWGVGGDAMSPGFEINDLGFQRNSDVATQFAYLGYDRTRGGAAIRRTALNVNQWTEWSFGSERLSRGGSIDTHLQFRSFWGVRGGYERNLTGLNTDGLRGGPALWTPESHRMWLTVYGDRRRPVLGQLTALVWTEEETGAYTVSLRPLLRGRPLTMLELTVQPNLTLQRQALNYITQRRAGDGTHYILGEVDQTTATVLTRLDFTAARTLSIRLYAAPYVTTRSASRFGEIVDPRAPDIGDRFRRFTPDEISFNGESGRYEVDLSGDGRADFTFPEPGFRFTHFRSDLAVSWEYRRGSTVHVVWNRERSLFERGLTQDLAETVNLEDQRLIPATNVITVKIDVWLGG